MDSIPRAAVVIEDVPVQNFSPAARRVQTAVPVCNILERVT